MDEDRVVILRPFDAIHDLAYIYASWRNSAYYSAAQRSELPPKDFFKEQSGKIKRILEHAKVTIACFEDTPNVIVGYAVQTGTHLDWILVKPDYRKKGIGKLLMPKDIETVTEQLTKIGKEIVEKKNLKVKGESNGRNDSKLRPQIQKENPFARPNKIYH